MRRSKRVSFALLAAFLAVAFPALYFIQNSMGDSSGRVRAYGQAVYYLPPKEIIKLFSLGLDQAISDFFWIKSLTYTEHYVVTRMYEEMKTGPVPPNALMRDRQKVYELIDMTTYFDPKFVYAYEFGGSFFAWQGDAPLANAILEKGLKYNPNEWRLAYAMGFNHFFFYKDYDTAIKYFKMASKMPGSLVRGTLIAQIYLMKNESDAALSILYSFFNSARDPDTKAFYAARIRYFLVEKHIKALNEAIGVYEKRFGKPCEDLRELTAYGIIEKLPAEPFGGEYVIDYADHRAVNRPYRRYETIAKFFGVTGQVEGYRPKYEKNSSR